MPSHSSTIESQAKLAELLEDAAVLAELKHSGYWPTLEKLWQRHVEHLKEYTLQGMHDQFEYNKGRVHGALELLNLPEQIIRMAKESGHAA